MESTDLILYTAFPLLIMFLILKHYFSRKKYLLPPSPAPAIPFIGHLHLLKQPIHRTFQRFSEIHGPIFSLKLGNRRAVVVSSPELVEECFGTANDVVFSNRPRFLVGEYLGYSHTTMFSVPYGARWRSLRRMDEIRKKLQTLINRNREYHVKVELRPVLFELIFNIITRMLAGERYGSDEKNSEASEKFQALTREAFECAESSNPEDFFPFLSLIDCRGFKKKLGALNKKLDDFYEGLLEEHRREKRNTTIGNLLCLRESDPDFCTDQIIKGFMTAMINAGTETSIVTLEWAMSLLLNHPQVLQKAKLELDSQVGHQRLLEEQDLPNLPNLRNIIFETFRMFPPGPIPLPRESSADCKVGGYDVPCGSILMINAWAIHSDPKVWDEPTRFKPERFEGRDVETQMFLPFGMGRRAYPGAGLGQRMVGLVLGSLIQCFD
ncbi:hypothetical protein OROMI_029776 [Orobanche minor]